MKFIKNLFFVFIVLSFILMVLVISKSNETIIQIHSFHEVNFDSIPTTGTLVIFDVDETLIQPIDTYLLHDGYAKLFIQDLALQYIAKNIIKVSDSLYLASIMVKEAERPLIEPFIINEIKKMQMRDIPVIACTAMNTGKFGVLELMEKWRYEHLKSLGFEGSYNDVILSLDTGIKHPVFYRGILVTDVAPKGPAIEAFLTALDLHPSTIIMFDDNRNFLNSVKDECIKRKITFKGYHYLGAQENLNVKEKSWNEPLIRFQIDYLIKHKHWINDDTAYALMREQQKEKAIAAS